MGNVRDWALAILAAAVIHGAVYLWRKFIPLIRREGLGVLRSVGWADILWGVVWSLVCALLWSLSFVSLSYVSRSVDVFDVNIIMMGSASCFLLVAYLIVRARTALLGRSKQDVPEAAVDWRTWTPWIATAGNLANFLLFVYALYFISASQAITLGETSPVFVVLLTWFWLRQRLPISTLTAAALAVVGAILIVADQNFAFPMNSSATYGSILAVCGGAGFAVFGTSLEKIERGKHSLSSRLSFMGVTFAISCGVVLAVAYLAHRVPATIDNRSMTILVLNGLRVAVVYLLYQVAVRHIGALLAGILITLDVPLTMLWDSRLLHRQVVAKLVIGAAAILIAGFTLASDRWRAMRSRGPEPTFEN